MQLHLLAAAEHRADTPGAPNNEGAQDCHLSVAVECRSFVLRVPGVLQPVSRDLLFSIGLVPAEQHPAAEVFVGARPARLISEFLAGMLPANALIHFCHQMPDCAGNHQSGSSAL